MPTLTTRAAVLYALGEPLRVETIELNPPQANDVLIHVKAAGVCHSDWHLMSGATQHPLPVVLGHEGAGVVEATGSAVTHVRPGDHVALSWAPNCGECFYCRDGSPSLCATYLDAIWAGVMMDGTPRFQKAGRPIYQYCSLGCFADRVVVPAECCIPMPAGVPHEIAALIGCAVTTGVGAALNTAQVKPGSSVAVLGAGGVGLSAVMGAALAGASRIIVVDRAAAKRELVARFGATDFVAAGPQVVAEIQALTHGRGADYVIEAVGHPDVQELALACARPGGLIVLAGLAPMGSSTNLPGALITRQEKTVKGSYYGSANPAREFPRLAELFTLGKLPLERLVSRTWRLEEINEAYAHLLTGESARGVVRLGE
jgi:Zn-dependent alcohol dehydrogenase